MSLERAAFILTGKFSLPKKYVKEELLKNGGEVVKTKIVTKVTFLLCGKKANLDKIRRAILLGISVIDEKYLQHVLLSEKILVPWFLHETICSLNQNNRFSDSKMYLMQEEPKDGLEMKAGMDNSLMFSPFTCAKNAKSYILKARQCEQDGDIQGALTKYKKAAQFIPKENLKKLYSKINSLEQDLLFQVLSTSFVEPPSFLASDASNIPPPSKLVLPPPIVYSEETVPLPEEVCVIQPEVEEEERNEGNEEGEDNREEEEIEQVVESEEKLVEYIEHIETAPNLADLNDLDWEAPIEVPSSIPTVVQVSEAHNSLKEGNNAVLLASSPLLLNSSHHSTLPSTSEMPVFIQTPISITQLQLPQPSVETVHSDVATSTPIIPSPPPLLPTPQCSPLMPTQSTQSMPTSKPTPIVPIQSTQFMPTPQPSPTFQSTPIVPIPQSTPIVPIQSTQTIPKSISQQPTKKVKVPTNSKKATQKKTQKKKANSKKETETKSSSPNVSVFTFKPEPTPERVESSPASTILQGTVFYLYGSFTMRQETIKYLIRRNGGKVSNRLNENVTHLMVGGSFSGETVEKGRKLGVHIVEESFFRLVLRSVSLSKI